MHFTLAVCFFIVSQFLNWGVESASPAHHSTKAIPFVINKNNFDNYKCGSPKPQLFYIGNALPRRQSSTFKLNVFVFYLKGDEFETAEYAGKVFDPPAVLVNRCSRITGCCPAGENCAMATEEQVMFAVHVILDDGEFHEVHVPVKNHTSCRCVGEDESYDGQPADESGNDNYKLNILIIVAIVCGVICVSLCSFVAFISVSILNNVKGQQSTNAHYSYVDFENFKPLVKIKTTME